MVGSDCCHLDLRECAGAQQIHAEIGRRESLAGVRISLHAREAGVLLPDQ
jgi:hypothetical protein